MNGARKVVLDPIVRYVTKAMRAFLASAEGTSYITQLGTITADYVSGLPRVKFDRDAAASGKGYCYVAPYTPAANDRVLMLKVNHDWVIVGKVVSA